MRASAIHGPVIGKEPLGVVTKHRHDFLVDAELRSHFLDEIAVFQLDFLRGINHLVDVLAVVGIDAAGDEYVGHLFSLKVSLCTYLSG
ncbi:hypothetical protein D3C84_1082000 [compost metagenome]